MAARSKLLAVCLLLPLLIQAQFGNTFAYTGDDLRRSQAEVHWAHFGGFTNNLALQGGAVVHPFLPALFYEASYLIQPSNEFANFAIGVIPEAFVSVLFMGRVTAMADVLLFQEASNKPGKGVGLRAGLGYGVLGSTFELVESSPVARVGILISNIRVTYAYSTDRRTVIDHQLGVGIKFDW
jgi:hypothetical protein